MNKKRILKLADLIERQLHVPITDGAGFSMDGYKHHCNTPSCIAGWAAYMANPSVLKRRDYDIEQAAIAYLDLGSGIPGELFAPDVVEWSDITPAQAACTLRHLAETGEVVWEVDAT